MCSEWSVTHLSGRAAHICIDPQPQFGAPCPVAPVPVPGGTLIAGVYASVYWGVTMLSDDPVYDRRRTVLCIRSRRAGTLLDRGLAAYDCCVVHDARIACRKAKLGAFDLYVAVDPQSSKAAAECWRSMREFDRNTPFLFVLRTPLPPAVEQLLVPGVDACVAYTETPSTLAHAVRQLLALAERRSLDARREETLAIRDDIRERLTRLEWRMQLSRASMARAQEHVMRAYALQSFTRLGGTKSFFERLWPDAYEEALRHTGEGGPSASR